MLPMLRLVLIKYWLSSIGVFPTIRYYLIIVETICLKYEYSQHTCLISYATGIRHNWVWWAYFLMQYLDVLDYSQPNGICNILKFKNVPGPGQGLKFFLEKIFAYPWMGIQELSIYSYIMSNFIGCCAMWMLGSLSLHVLCNFHFWRFSFERTGVLLSIESIL